MNKADKYLKELIVDIQENGTWSTNPRTKWLDGTPAHYKQVRQKVYNYNILKGEYPITTLRNTPLKGCFYEMEWIYLKQSHLIEEAHPSIRSWWEDFVVTKHYKYLDYFEEGCVVGFSDDYKTIADEKGRKYELDSQSIGFTYGAIVKEYGLIDKLLYNMEYNWESRRLNMDLWQERELRSRNKPLPPCAYRTDWSIEEGEELIDYSYSGLANGSPIYKTVRYIDFNLSQRSRDSLMTFSINPIEYVMLAMMIANHLTFKTGIEHKVRNLQHIVFNEHIYDKHFEAANEILLRESTGLQPKIKLICEPKDFYSHTWEDFKFEGLEGIKPLSTKLELAI